VNEIVTGIGIATGIGEIEIGIGIGTETLATEMSGRGGKKMPVDEKKKIAAGTQNTTANLFTDEARQTVHTTTTRSIRRSPLLNNEDMVDTIRIFTAGFGHS